MLKRKRCLGKNWELKMGGGGGSFGSDDDPRDLVKKLQEAEARVDHHVFNQELDSLLSTSLRNYNDRDSAGVRERIGEILTALGELVEGKPAMVFGGSVAKHTYIEGLSDIDCLLVLNDTGLDRSTPQQILHQVAEKLSEELGNGVGATAGNLAVTVQYADGMEIQLVPAIRSDAGTKIPSSREPERWSSIDPEKFSEGLTKYNEQCGGKLVPTIKLAKAIIAQLPEANQLSGYHIESLAIDAFRSYQGARTPAAMLPHFFNHAKDRVLRPMTDSTGQSVHVDEYMGEADSSARTNASHLLGRLSRRIASANAARSLPQWEDLLGESE